MAAVNSVQGTQSYIQQPPVDWTEEEADSAPGTTSTACSAGQAGTGVAPSGQAPAEGTGGGTGVTAGTTAAAGATAATASSESAEARAAKIKAAWQAQNANPYRVMQMMVEFGWSGADLASATGLTTEAIANYLTVYGAPIGFGGLVTTRREDTDKAYLEALDAATKEPPETSKWMQQVGQLDNDGGTVYTGSFDLNGFNQWYVSQNTPLTQAFAQLHGTDFSLNGASLQLGGWKREDIGNSESRDVWSSSSIRWSDFHEAAGENICAYVKFPKASAEEIGALHIALNDPYNKEIIAAYDKPVALPESEQGERMRARYGTELATQMLQLNLATNAVRNSYCDTLYETMQQSANANILQDENAASMVPPGVQVDELSDPNQPFWKVSGYSNGEGYTQWSTFDMKAFHTWYVNQDTPQSRMFTHLFGKDMTVIDTPTEGLDGGPAHVAHRYLVGDNGGFEITPAERKAAEGDSGADWVWARPTMELSAESGVSAVTLDHTHDLYEHSVVFFDPVMGFITPNQNVKPEDTGVFEQVVTGLMLVVASVMTAGVASAAFGIAGAAAASASTASLMAVGAITGAAGSFFSAMVGGGDLTLKGVLRGAITGALTAGLMKGVNEIAQQAGGASQVVGASGAGGAEAVEASVSDASIMERVNLDGLGGTGADLLAAPVGQLSPLGTVIQVAGGATVQGALQQLLGGKFKDGFLAGLASGLAGAITAKIDAAIDASGMTGPEAVQAKALSRMFGSAVRVLGSGGDDSAMAFARDLVGGALNELDKEEPSSNAPAAPASVATPEAQGSAAPQEQSPPSPALAPTPEPVQSPAPPPAPRPYDNGPIDVAFNPSTNSWNAVGPPPPAPAAQSDSNAAATANPNPDNTASPTTPAPPPEVNAGTPSAATNLPPAPSPAPDSNTAPIASVPVQPQPDANAATVPQPATDRSEGATSSTPPERTAPPDATPVARNRTAVDSNTGVFDISNLSLGNPDNVNDESDPANRQNQALDQWGTEALARARAQDAAASTTFIAGRGAVGGFSGIAAQLLGPKTPEAQVVQLALQLQTSNPDINTREIGRDTVLNKPTDKVSPEAQRDYAADARFQASLQKPAPIVNRGTYTGIPDLADMYPNDSFEARVQEEQVYQNRNPVPNGVVLPINTMAINAPDYGLRAIYKVGAVPLTGAMELGAIATDWAGAAYTFARHELGGGLDILPARSQSLRALESGMPVDEYLGRVNPVGNVMFSWHDMTSAAEHGNWETAADSGANLTIGVIGGASLIRGVASPLAGSVRSLSASVNIPSSTEIGRFSIKYDGDLTQARLNLLELSIDPNIQASGGIKNPLIADAISRNGDRLVLNQGAAPTCGANSCGMVLDTIGKPVDVAALIKKIPPTAEGIYPTDVATLMKSQGVDAMTLSRRNLSDLLRYTENGTPVVVRVTDPGVSDFSHFVVVDGVTTRNGVQVVAIRDPHGAQYFSPASTFNKSFTGEVVVPKPIKMPVIQRK